MRVLALLVLAFVGLSPLPAAAQSIKVGSVVPLTGRYGGGGAQVRAGYEIKPWSRSTRRAASAWAARK